MLKLSDSYYTIAHNLIAMIVQKLPYILFRSYSSYGYLTDNRNFGYDTASHSCKKVGELILSNTGKVFYANLKDIPEKLDDVILRLSKLYSAVPVAVISRDALEFYKELYSKGFIFMGDEHDYADFVSHYFSYDNRQTFELNIPQLQASQTIYEETFGTKYSLSRVHVDISSRCNERCVHCYIPEKNKCTIMPENVFDRILSQCRSMNVLNITISGGEPLLNPNLKRFLLECSRYNFSVNLLSNLTLLSEELIDLIAANPLISIQTSLYSMDESVHDSITRKKGSFKQTLHSIKELHARNIPIQINCPVMKQNKSDYKGVLEFAKSLNIEADYDYSLYGSYDLTSSNLLCRLSAEEIENIEKTKVLNNSELESIKNKQKDSSTPICPVCKSSLCVSNNGDVYPCEGWQNLKLGNIEKQSLKEIWDENPIVLGLRNLQYKDFPKCNSCLRKQFCSICLIMNVNEDIKGDYSNVNPFICKVAKIKERNYRKASIL